MTSYKIEKDFNQEFIIDYHGEKLTIALRYIPLNNGLYLSLPGKVHGLKVSLSMPILAGYGYPNFFIIKKNTAVKWLGELDDLFIYILEDVEVEEVVRPVLIADSMGMRII